MKLKDLTPMLETDDVAGTVKFYCELLGFECTGRWRSVKLKPFLDDPKA